jgi:ABC-2 type transport system permease protein
VRRLLLADLAARRRMIVGLAIGTGVFVAALASIEALGGLSDIGRRAFGDTPPALAAVAGTRSGFDVFTPLGLLAFAFNHPFFLALGLAAGIGIGSAAIAGDVDSGRAQLLYVRPIPRHRILNGRLLFWLLAQAAVVAAGVAGGTLASSLSDALGSEGVTVSVRAGFQFLPLALVVGAIAFAVSAFARTRARALGVTLGIVFLAYLANFVSLVWSAAEPLRWITPFGYYDPLAVVDGIRWSDLALLSAATVVLLGLAHVGLARRDLA